MDLGIKRVLDKLFNPDKPKESRFADLDEMDEGELVRLSKLVLESGFVQGFENPTNEGRSIPRLNQEKELPKKVIVSSGKEKE